MPRKPRFFASDVAYHIVSRGNNRQQLFLDQADIEKFLSLLRSLKQEHPCHIYHYCLMSNHVHLLIQFPHRLSFQKLPQRLFLLYAKYFSRRNGHVGHVFQDRFKSFVVADSRYLLECGRYIERNPLKAGLVGHPAHYRWSSFPHYGLGIANDLVTENPLFSELASSPADRQRAYAQLVCVERPYEEIVEKAVFGRQRHRKVSL